MKMFMFCLCLSQHIHSKYNLKARKISLFFSLKGKPKLPGPAVDGTFVVVVPARVVAATVGVGSVVDPTGVAAFADVVSVI